MVIISTETSANETGLETGRSTPRTREEIEQEMQVCKDRYLRCSLKLKQMEANCEIEKANHTQCKVVEQKEKLLQALDEAQRLRAEFVQRA